MSGTQKSFRFWVSYWDVAQELTPKQQGEFYRAVVDYMFTDNDPEDSLKGTVKMCFKAIKANLNTSKIRSELGTKGNASRWSSDEETESQTHRKAIAHESQSYRKPIANVSQIKTQIKSKSKSQIKSDTASHEAEGDFSIPPSARAELVKLGMLREVE